MRLPLLTNILITLWFSSLAVFAIWEIYPYRILEIKTQPYQVIKPIYMPGETLEYLVDFCKYGSYKSKVTYQFLSNNVVYGSMVSESDLDKGCYKLTSRTLLVPDLPNGKYTVRIINTYRPNPIREISVKAMVSEFEIRNPELIPLPTPTTTPSATPSATVKPGIVKSQNKNVNPIVNSPAPIVTSAPQPQNQQPVQQSQSVTVQQPQQQAPTPQPEPSPSPQGGLIQGVGDLLNRIL